MHSNSSKKYIADAANILDEWDISKPELLPKAKQKLLTALTLNPKSVQARIEMARYYIMVGDLSSAEQSLLEAKEIDIKNANTYVLMGHLYFLQDRKQDAQNALIQAETIGTKNPWLFMNKAAILNKEYKFDQAAILWHKALENSNGNAKVVKSALGELANHYQYKKDFAKATKLYNELITRYPNYAYGYGNRAQYKLCALDDKDGALIDAKKALSFFSFGHAKRTIAASKLLQWVHYKNNQKTIEAKQVWTEVNPVYINKPLSTVASTCSYNYQWKIFAEAFNKYYPVEKMTYQQKGDLAYFYYANDNLVRAQELQPETYNPE